MSEILRRDPRTEWIRRNRLHPQYVLTMMSSGEPQGPSGLVRRNPHAVGFIGPNGIRRIDRMNVSGPIGHGGKRVGNTIKTTVLPLHRVEQVEYYIAVVPDMVGGRLSEHDRDVLGQAHALIREIGGAGAVLAIVFGEHREQAFDTAGVDRLLELNGAGYQEYAPELRVAALSEVDSQFAPRHWLLPDSVAGGFELGCRLAARLGERPATQAWRVDAAQSVCRGAGGSIDITRATPRMLLLAPE
ncbi:MAG: electron transfer flavoprotein subunit alpha/FixB family protein, partial [Serratia inhibens]